MLWPYGYSSLITLWFIVMCRCKIRKKKQEKQEECEIMHLFSFNMQSRRLNKKTKSLCRIKLNTYLCKELYAILLIT